MLNWPKYCILTVLFLCSCSKNAKILNEMAVFGGGCFWTLDFYFEKIDGVQEVICVYTESGSEAVQVKYDPQKVSFSKLCKVFMKIHAPETDYKAKYRSLIQTDNPENFKIALAIVNELKKSADVKTTVEKTGPLTIPDEMHEDWHKNKNSEPKCHLPKGSFEELMNSLN